jgi:hypothetical protein
MLFQQQLLSGCVRIVCSRLLTSCQWFVDNLLQGCWTRQVIPTTCYRPAIQQILNKL